MTAEMTTGSIMGFAKFPPAGTDMEVAEAFGYLPHLGGWEQYCYDLRTLGKKMLERIVWT